MKKFLYIIFRRIINLHSDARDYAWGAGGLDAIITQVSNRPIYKYQFNLNKHIYIYIIYKYTL